MNKRINGHARGSKLRLQTQSLFWYSGCPRTQNLYVNCVVMRKNQLITVITLQSHNYLESIHLQQSPHSRSNLAKKLLNLKTVTNLLDQQTGTAQQYNKPIDCNVGAHQTLLPCISNLTQWIILLLRQHRVPDKKFYKVYYTVSNNCFNLPTVKNTSELGGVP